VRELLKRIMQALCLHEAHMVEPLHRCTFSLGDNAPYSVHTKIECRRCKLRWWHVVKLERPCLVCGELTTSSGDLCRLCEDI